MNFMCGFIIEDEEMQKASRIVLLLPGNVHSSAGFAGLNIADEFFNGSLHFVDA